MGPRFLALLLLAASVQAADWNVTGSSVTFVVMNGSHPVKGSLTGLKADIRFDPSSLETSAIRASVETTTIKTGIALRDRHLRSEDYFYSTLYPKIVMECDRFESLGNGKYLGAFQVTMRGKKKRVDVPFTFRSGGGTGRFAGTVTIDRTEFGVGGRSRFVADQVAVTVEVDVQRVGE
ncbi:MAG TPA: YceI family protein [Thermoanaerobaculia bacterium]|nr:YceI family protein [Thermoanaerobaculia bacterium]